MDAAGKLRLGRRLGLLIPLGALLALPAVADFGVLNVAIKVAIAGIFAMSFNLLWGQAGLLSFGHAAYFGLGTFASIYAMQSIEAGSGLPTPLVPLAGALAGFVSGLLAGWLATMRSGVYFAMITVALAELVAAVAVKWEGVFGGEGGLRATRTGWGPFGLQQVSDVYWLTLGWALLAIGVLWWLQRSPLGTVVRSVRERELRASFLGYETHALKTMVFAVSAALAGLAGGLLALSDEAANMVLFQGTGSAFVVVNTIIGGAGVFFGPMAGAAMTTLFSYYVADLTPYWMLYLGLVFIAVVIHAPGGLAGVVLQRFRAATAGREPWLSVREARATLGVVLLAAGVVFAVEIIGRLCSPEYAAARLSAGAGWPPVRRFGVSWTLPGGLLVAGVLFGLGARLCRPGRATVRAATRLKARLTA